MYRKFGKRLFDIIVSLFATPFVLLIVGICAITVKLDDAGSAFYSAKRLGKGGKSFTMFKLRTMKLNAPDLRNDDGSTYNAEDDPRLTKLGKFFRKTSLDELPQIFNVLLGDMSFVGPRPDLLEHINCYEGDEFKKLNVLPGISGYNQAYFRNTIDWKQRLKNDVYYVDNVSFLMDIKILFKTFEGVLLRKGIYKTETKTDIIAAISKERNDDDKIEEAS